MVEYLPVIQFVTFTVFEAIGSINYYNNIKIYTGGAKNLHTCINVYDSLNILVRQVRQLLTFFIDEVTAVCLVQQEVKSGIWSQCSFLSSAWLVIFYKQCIDYSPSLEESSKQREFTELIVEMMAFTMPECTAHSVRQWKT